jgi:hypothetical protein
MTGSAGLERGYRRLLAAFPQSFRREQEEELLGVLMAGARTGQRWPGLAEVVDVAVSGLRMRLRRARAGPVSRDWAEALASLSVVAPLLVVVAGLLEVAVPYHLPPANRDPDLFHWAHFHLAGAPREIGGLSLLHLPGFDIVLGGQLVIAVLVLLGWRRLALAALAAVAGFWMVTGFGGVPGFWMPGPVQAMAAAACVLEAAALVASPACGQARRLLSWRHGVVLLLAAAAVQVLTLLSDARSNMAQTGVLVRATTAHSAQWQQVSGPGISGYVIVAVVLAAVATGLAVAFRLNRYLVLLAVLLYPVVLELAAAAYELIGLPTPRHLALLFVPPLVLLAGVMISARTGLRLRLERGRPESA